MKKKLKEDSSALFQGVAVTRVGSPLRLSLEAPPYRLVEDTVKNLRVTNDTIDVPVVRDPALEKFYGGTLSTPSPSQAIEKAQMELIGTGCVAITNETGFFKFFPCNESHRLINPRVRVTLPGREPCPDLINLQPIDRLSDLMIGLDCTKPGSQPANPLEPIRVDGGIALRVEKGDCASIKSVLGDYFRRYGRDIRSDSEPEGALGCFRPCHVSVDHGSIFASPDGKRPMPLRGVRLAADISCHTTVM